MTPHASPEIESVLLEQAYLLLARRTTVAPTVEHLEAIDAMHRARYDLLLAKINELEDRCHDVQEGLSRMAVALEDKRWDTL